MGQTKYGLRGLISARDPEPRRQRGCFETLVFSLKDLSSKLNMLFSKDRLYCQLLLGNILHPLDSVVIQKESVNPR